MDPNKIETVQNFRAPTCKKELQSFLGFLNFYRKYVNKFTKIIEPLIELLKKGFKMEVDGAPSNNFQPGKNGLPGRYNTLVTRLQTILTRNH